MAAALPAPPGTIYQVKLGAYRAPGRPSVPLTGDSPDTPPFLLDRGFRVDVGERLRV